MAAKRTRRRRSEQQELLLPRDLDLPALVPVWERAWEQTRAWERTFELVEAAIEVDDAAVVLQVQQDPRLAGDVGQRRRGQGRVVGLGIEFDAAAGRARLDRVRARVGVSLDRGGHREACERECQEYPVEDVHLPEDVLYLEVAWADHDIADEEMQLIRRTLTEQPMAKRYRPPRN